LSPSCLPLHGSQPYSSRPTDLHGPDPMRRIAILVLLAGSRQSCCYAATLGSQIPSAAVTSEAAAIRSEAAQLHKAGDYTGSAKRFQEAIRLSSADKPDNEDVYLGYLGLAATLIKLTSFQEAEEACSNVVKQPRGVISTAVRQKAFFRRARARHGLCEGCSEEAGSSGMAMKAYRDAFIAVKLAPMDTKAAQLMDEIVQEQGLAQEARSEAESKALSYLGTLGPLAMSGAQPRAGGMPDMMSMLGGMGGTGASAGAGDVGGLPGMMSMLGGMGGAGGMGGMASMLPSLLGGLGGTNGLQSGDPKAMMKTVKKLLRMGKKQLRGNPAVQKMVLSFMHKATPDTLKALDLPISEARAEQLGTVMTAATEETLLGWVDIGEIVGLTLKRLMQIQRAVMKM
ncbi:unnamed protein product, partial [Chrysoparadoxa australica]